MPITGGITRDCTVSCAGGLRRIWVANAQDIDTITIGVDGSVTALAMVGLAVFHELQVTKNTRNFTQGTNVNNCSYALAQNWTGIAQCYSQDIRNTIIEMAKQSCCGIVVIMEDSNGGVWMWGHITEQEAKLGDGTQWDTGTAITDPNQVTINLICETTVDGAATDFAPGVAGIPV